MALAGYTRFVQAVCIITWLVTMEPDELPFAYLWATLHSVSVSKVIDPEHSPEQGGF